MKENESDVEMVCREFNAAINFAIDDADGDGILFLRLWREGDWDSIAKEFPEFKGPLPTLPGERAF